MQLENIIKKTTLSIGLSALVFSPFLVVKYKETKKQELFRKEGAPLELYLEEPSKYYFNPDLLENLDSGNKERDILIKKIVFKTLYEDLAKEFPDAFPKYITKAGLKEDFIFDCVNLIFAENKNGSLNSISRSKIINKNFKKEKIGRGIGQFIYPTWQEVIKDIGKKNIEKLGFDYETLLSYEGWLHYTLPKNGKTPREKYNILKLNMLAIIDYAKINERALVRKSDIENYPKKLLEAVILSHNSGYYVQLRSWKKRRDVFRGYKRVNNLRGGELKPFYKNLMKHKKYGWNKKDLYALR